MEEKIVKTEEQSTPSMMEKFMAWLPLILTFAGYFFLFLKYIFAWALYDYASVVLRLIFFAFAFACIITYFILTFFVKKSTKFDALTIVNLIALFICFQ